METAVISLYFKFLNQPILNIWLSENFMVGLLHFFFITDKASGGAAPSKGSRFTRTEQLQFAQVSLLPKLAYFFIVISYL